MTVGVQHLKSFNYLPAECHTKLQEIYARIRKIQENSQLEATAEAVLKCLGELKRPYLTQMEEKLLSLIEQEYRVMAQ
ncbi:hypothetical protein H6G75_31755 [Nostoc sp. FACHB-280]|nr:hypothetical protein [Nostoc sp. FACHB-280]